MSQDPVFLDHVSTTPVDERVVEAMLPYFTEWYGNPSSHIHTQGATVSAAIDAAREPLKTLVGNPDATVVYTSGATEANNLAVLGLAANTDSNRKHILFGEIEHFSITNTVPMLEAHGYTVEFVPVNLDGVISPETLREMLREDTALVSIQHANPEIGVIQPIAELAALAKAKGALFHTDATVSAGHIPIEMANWGVDALTISAHNFYGPKGVGALLLAKGVRPKARMFGGWQENGLRSGTENVPGIIGMAKAAELAISEMAERKEKLDALTKILKAGLTEKVPFIHFTGGFENRMPGHVSFWCEHVEGESLILFMNAKNLMAASGSACSSNLKAKDEDELVASHVLAAVGVPTDICAGSVCLSLGKDNKEADINRLLEELPPIVERLLSMSPSYADYLKLQNS